MKIAIVGAGPAGAFLAAALGARGHQIDLIDQRPDPLQQQADRSIQLSLSPRGRAALHSLGLLDELERAAVPMFARVFHLRGGGRDLRRYADPSWHLHSIHRAELAGMLLRRALELPNVTARFGRYCLDVRRKPATVVLQAPDHTIETVAADLVIGADGAASNVRAALLRNPAVRFAKTTATHGYLEWTLDAPFASSELAEPAPHIWPRSRWFLVSFPGRDGRHHGSFVAAHELWQTLRAEGRLEAALREDFGDVLPHLATPLERILSSDLITVPIVRFESYFDGDQILLIGDAAHAGAPFMGQGVNLALEDARTLVEALDRSDKPLVETLTAFSAQRVVEGLACCDLSEQAAYSLFEPPPPGGAHLHPLAKLNFLGASYRSVAEEVMPGWQPKVQVRPPVQSGKLTFALPESLKARMTLQEGETLIARGEAGDALYLVESGEVTVHTEDDQTIHLVAPVLVGEMAWFGEQRQATVRAEETCSVARVAFSALETWCQRFPTEGLALARGLALLAINRMRTGFHLNPRYWVLVVSPDARDEALVWCQEQRAGLAEVPILTDPAMTQLLQTKLDLRVAREVDLAHETGWRALEQALAAGQLASIVAVGSPLPPPLLQRLGEPGRALLRAPGEASFQAGSFPLEASA